MTRVEPPSSPNAHFLIGEVLANHRELRWWGGPWLSLAVHAAGLVAILYAATHPSQVARTADAVSNQLKFVLTPAPGIGGKGGGGRPAAAPPRAARAPEIRSVDPIRPAVTPPETITPAATVPVIATQSVETLPGALTAIDASSAGPGFGPGGGGVRGLGSGPGDGSGAGDTYEAGVGGVTEPKLIHEVKPNFTVDAMRAKIQGVVVMDVVVLADGSVDPRRIRITRSLDPGLDREAVIAVKQWRFRPSTRQGQPVAARAMVELAFTLR